MSSSTPTSITLYSGSALARIALAKQALETLTVYRGFEGPALDPDGMRRPVIHGVIVADHGLLYTYVRGDHGGLAESVEHAVGAGPKAKPPMDASVPDWQQDLTAGEFLAWQAAQPPREPPPHPDAGTELAPAVEENLLAAFDVEEAIANEAAPKRHAGHQRRFDHDKARRMVSFAMPKTGIARYLGVSINSINRITKGVDVRRGIKGAKRWNRLGAYISAKAGDPLYAVSEKFGVDRCVVENLVRNIDGRVA